MSLEERYQIAKSVGEECNHEEELRNLLANKPEPVCYDGIEPSGRMDIAQADICQLGMDQRKVNVLARESIILSHHMLPGLLEWQESLSSSIFMEDEEAKMNLKVKKAYCPPKIVEGNPCLEYVKYLILPWFKEFTVERNAENGGHKTFTSFEELIADYESGELHPADLKPALSKALNKILELVREHFKKDSNAKDLLERVEAYIITR